MKICACSKVNSMWKRLVLGWIVPKLFVNGAIMNSIGLGWTILPRAFGGTNSTL